MERPKTRRRGDVRNESRELDARKRAQKYLKSSSNAPSRTHIQSQPQRSEDLVKNITSYTADIDDDDDELRLRSSLNSTMDDTPKRNQRFGKELQGKMPFSYMNIDDNVNAYLDFSSDEDEEDENEDEVVTSQALAQAHNIDVDTKASVVPVSSSATADSKISPSKIRVAGDGLGLSIVQSIPDYNYESGSASDGDDDESGYSEDYEAESVQSVEEVEEEEVEIEENGDQEEEEEEAVNPLRWSSTQKFDDDDEEEEEVEEVAVLEDVEEQVDEIFEEEGESGEKEKEEEKPKESIPVHIPIRYDNEAGESDVEEEVVSLANSVSDVYDFGESDDGEGEGIDVQNSMELDNGYVDGYGYEDDFEESLNMTATGTGNMSVKRDGRGVGKKEEREKEREREGVRLSASGQSQGQGFGFGLSSLTDSNSSLPSLLNPSHRRPPSTSTPEGHRPGVSSVRKEKEKEKVRERENVHYDNAGNRYNEDVPHTPRSQGEEKGGVGVGVNYHMSYTPQGPPASPWAWQPYTQGQGEGEGGGSYPPYNMPYPPPPPYPYYPYPTPYTYPYAYPPYPPTHPHTQPEVASPPRRVASNRKVGSALTSLIEQQLAGLDEMLKASRARVERSETSYNSSRNGNGNRKPFEYTTLEETRAYIAKKVKVRVKVKKKGKRR